MRVVWASASLPHPEAAGGSAHEFELVAGLSGRHRVHVLAGEAAGRLGPDALLDAGATVESVPWRSRPAPANRLAVARAVPIARPNLVLWLKRDRLRAMAEALRRHVATAPVDLVHVTQGELAPLVATVPAPSALLLFDALTREIEGRLAAAALPRRRAQLALERRRTAAFERRWYRQADVVASVSPVDARRIEAFTGRPVTVIENPVADRFFEPPTSPRTRDVVTFVGSLNHLPNTDAIGWLATEVWPLVVAAQPGARLRVVGRGDAEGVTTARLRAVVEAAGGELHADVDDIRPAYWEAAVVISPVRTGAGMRNKVIHAMACGAPVVSTGLGLEGVPAGAAAAAAVADDAAGLAAAVVATLSAPADVVAERVAAARRSIEVLRTPIVAASLEAWWEAALTARDQSPSATAP